MSLSNTVFGAKVGTGANIDIELGFIPSYVCVENITSAGLEKLEWWAGMANASAIKTVAAGTRTKPTTLGITPLSSTFLGFRIGADTDVNVAAENIVWKAERNGPGSGR